MKNFFARYIKFTTVVLLLLVYGVCIYVIQRYSANATTSTTSIQQYQKSEGDLGTKYLILGDTGTGSLAQYNVAKAAETICRRLVCQAVFIAGDVIYDFGVSSVDDPAFQEKFEKPYADLNVPFYLAFGNHDYYGCIDCYLQYSEKSEKWNMPDRYYSFDIANDGRIFVIDTENFDQEQQQWLRSELAKVDGWRVVLGHRPLLTYEEQHGGEDWNGRAILEEILCYSADLYLSGHSHLLEDVGNIPNCQVRQVISGSGGAEPRKIKAENKSLFYYEGNGFITFQAEKERVIVKFINDKSKILYSFELTK